MPATTTLMNYLPRIEVTFDKWGQAQKVVLTYKDEEVDLSSFGHVLSVDGIVKGGEIPKTIIEFMALPVFTYTDEEPDESA